MEQDNTTQEASMPTIARDHIAWFETLGNTDVPTVGGKNA